MINRPVIAARMTKLKNGSYLAQCGRPTCGAPLGSAQPPSPEGRGVSIQYLMSYSRDPGGGPDPHRDWLMHAPRSREQSAAAGFSRRVDDDGTTYYAIIKPRPKRDRSGATVLDGRGQRVVRQSGRVAERSGTMSFAEHAAGLRGHVLRGEKPKLPAIIECGDCGRRNHVSIPEEASR
jgi:hypothetical protein